MECVCTTTDAIRIKVLAGTYEVRYLSMGNMVYLDINTNTKDPKHNK